MADADAAAKARIIAHMNRDHATSLSYFLQHFCQLSASQASSPTLVDISLSSLSLSSRDGKIHSIALDPPMTSFADARARTVELDQTARAALDISPYTVTTYVPPSSPVHVTVFGLCALTAVVFATRSYIVPGTLVYDQILHYFPGGPEMFLWLVKKVQPTTLAIHFIEIFLLDRTRLRKYGVRRGSGVWFAWMSSCLIEGYGCFQRVDALVGKQKRAAEKGH